MTPGSLLAGFSAGPHLGQTRSLVYASPKILYFVMQPSFICLLLKYVVGVLPVEDKLYTAALL